MFNEDIQYVSGELCVENASLARIAEKTGTPCYVYSFNRIKRNFLELESVFASFSPLIAYAVKANSNIAVINILAQLGAGADVVSMGEIRRSLTAGIAPGKVVFSGVGKTGTEMEFAFGNGIGQYNIESLEELHDLNAAAVATRRIANVAVRVNPDVAAGGHAKISTGRSPDKFGIPLAMAEDACRAAAELSNINLTGLGVHIGSQIMDVAPYVDAFRVIACKTVELREKGYTINTLDLGGGFGIPYDNEKKFPYAAYSDAVRELIQPLGVRIIVEPGRSLVADAGLLVSRAVRTKETPLRKFLILDAAMNDLMRPALYDATHPLAPVVMADEPGAELWDIVGPVCETSDTFARQHVMKRQDRDGLVAIGLTGAYGATLANEYNSRPLVPEVMVKGSEWKVIRPRPDLAEILSRDQIPDWSQN
ncbi:MAG: diaminopimelate decarboxylase [Hyphomonadaceae bacterium]|nr:diaminopimelate decarboxylase [Hyphomonadaceae bacterium]